MLFLLVFNLSALRAPSRPKDVAHRKANKKSLTEILLSRTNNHYPRCHLDSWTIHALARYQHISGNLRMPHVTDTQLKTFRIKMLYFFNNSSKYTFDKSKASVFPHALSGPYKKFPSRIPHTTRLSLSRTR